MKTPAPHFGATLRRVREYLGLTRPSLCLQAGLSLTALTRWESTEVFDGRRYLLHALLLALENQSARVKRPIAPADVKILHAPIEDEPPASLDTSAAGVHVGDVFLPGALLATVALAVGEFGTARVRGVLDGLLLSRPDSAPPLS